MNEQTVRRLDLPRLSTKLSVIGVALIFVLALVLPQARADIIEVETATNCPGTGCNGNSPYLLSQLLSILSQPNSIGPGTQKYVVINDIGNSFSFTLTSTGTGSGFADNGSCQINGGATSIFASCTLVSANGHSTTNGGTAIGTGGNGANFLFPATVTFTGSTALGQTFTLGFVSMQGNSSVIVPEPGSLTLLATGLLLLGTGLGRRVFRKL